MAPIHTAKLTASETDAAQLAESIANDPFLDGQTVDTSEISPGRWEVLVYFPEAPDAGQRAALKRHGKFTVERLPDADWVAKSLAGLSPVRAGPFLVHGSHDRAAARENDIAIEIEAGEAFGTGHHGTTAGCLVEIARVAATRPILNALDVGTGSGVLAFAIAEIAHAPVLASDIDPVATRVANENARLNGVARFVHSVTATGLDGRIFRERAPYDLIVANILAGPLAALAPAIERVSGGGATIILSGLLPTQKARIVAAYRATGLVLSRALVRDGWLTLTFTRPAKTKGAARHAHRPSRTSLLGRRV